VPKSEVNALTLIVVLIAAGLSGTMVPDHSILAMPLGGLVLLIVLFAFDREGYRDMGQSLGFAAVAGYCAARVVWPLLGYLVGGALGPLPWFSITWIVAALILWAIDISRMQKRASVQPYGIAPATAQAAAPVPRAVPVREEPVRAQTPSPATPARHGNVTSLFSQTPIVSAPEPAQPAPPQSFEEVAPMPAASVPAARAPAPAPAPVPLPQPVQVPRGSGKPATIYLNLVGEGLAVMRSVQAEHIGKDYYLIVEQMPPNENWEFQTGQVVRCQKRNLSSGKGLVAVEEAPRAS
jgi:MFS family permease